MLLENQLDDETITALRGYGELEELAGRHVLYVRKEEAMPAIVELLMGENQAFSVAPLTLEDYYLTALGGAK